MKGLTDLQASSREEPNRKGSSLTRNPRDPALAGTTESPSKRIPHQNDALSRNHESPGGDPDGPQRPCSEGSVTAEEPAVALRQIIWEPPGGNQQRHGRSARCKLSIVAERRRGGRETIGAETSRVWKHAGTPQRRSRSQTEPGRETPT